MSEHVSLALQFRVHRRYMRSVNLERDMGAQGSLDGYVVSSLSIDSVSRFFEGLFAPNAPRAWTITGVYGTGKSAFAHFLLSLAGPTSDPLRTEAFKLLADTSAGGKVAARLRTKLPKEGLIRAIATGQRESLSTTVLRALENGATTFWAHRGGRRPDVLGDISRAAKKARPASGRQVVEWAEALADASGTGLVLVLDEMGKSLEHAANSLSGTDDVYLLQQLAEASGSANRRFAVVGLLHQGFGEYGAGLGVDRRAEWSKIQGRFEDISFSEPPDQMLRIIGKAVGRRVPKPLEKWVWNSSSDWHGVLSGQGMDRYIGQALSAETIADLLPLHPVAALVLPSLCTKYAQNDRSLFTFLASEEPHAFTRFLKEHTSSNEGIPLQRLDDLYDYFAGLAAQAVGYRPQFQRWAEIHSVVSDARNLDSDALVAIKTIAALNLTAAAGPLRASRGLTLAALCEQPRASGERHRWEKVVDGLVAKGLVTYRKQLDEYRLWEGSDFDVESALRAASSTRHPSLAAVLEDAVPLGPLVAERHSYRTGTLRYFERRYADGTSAIEKAECRRADSDGLLLYWVGGNPLPTIPPTTGDGRPLVVVEAGGLSVLSSSAIEFSGLKRLVRSEPHLQNDGIARKEVLHRLRLARGALDRVVRDSLFGSLMKCWVDGHLVELSGTKLRAELSAICDRVYSKSMTLWNELINRRELTSQGAKARRELLEAMLRSGAKERLALEGNGPETSMYDGVLLKPGIHRNVDGQWVFMAPREAGMRSAWNAILSFCQAAKTSPRTVDELLTLLERPPYGIKRGAVPVLLAAVLLAESESLSVFRDGSFLPSLGAEHFELLVKYPERFAVKHFALDGIRAEVFRDLEHVVEGTGDVQSISTRNRTILGVVRPLMQFVANLPPATLRTAQLSKQATSVREALRTAREPDSLLFRELPVALGQAPFESGAPANSKRRSEFRSALVAALKDLQAFHDRRRDAALKLIHAAFGVSADVKKLRSDLTARVQSLANRPLEDRLRAFVGAVNNDTESANDWIESLVMVISDRPLKTWTDEDNAAFEGRVSDLSRRFANLESIHSASSTRIPGKEPHRLTVTGADGKEVHRVVWIGADEQRIAGPIAKELLERMASLPGGQREVMLALLANSLLADPKGDPRHPSLTVVKNG